SQHMNQQATTVDLALNLTSSNQSSTESITPSFITDKANASTKFQPASGSQTWMTSSDFRIESERSISTDHPETRTEGGAQPPRLNDISTSLPDAAGTPAKEQLPMMTNEVPTASSPDKPDGSSAQNMPVSSLIAQPDVKKIAQQTDQTTVQMQSQQK